MPLISVIMATYNRAHTLPRAISSLLLQTIDNWELIVIDDGSTDSTQQILHSHFTDPRIKIVNNTKNCGVAASRNRGLDLIKGEWFTLLDSDDEIIPNAFEALLNIPNTIDKRINAVSCNCINSVSGKFTGLGLEHDQWLDFETLVTRCSGEHWGLTKTSLLGNNRFNPALPWGESVLWYKISKNAYRYYLNQGLRIYHVEGDDRLCKKERSLDIEVKSRYYRELAKETDYLEILRDYRPFDYANILFRIAIVHVLEKRMEQARQVARDGSRVWSANQCLAINTALLLGPTFLRNVLPVLLKYR